MFDHFGFLAPIYERAIPLRHAEKLLAHLDLPVRGAILDIGGGTGRVAQALVGRGSPVAVVDVSSKMLLEARKKPGLVQALAPSEQLPFADGTFERILMVDALHHVASQRHTAQEMWRVLKPGGRIIIEEPDIRTLVVKLVALAEKLALMRSHFLSPAQISALFTAPTARATIDADGVNAWVIVEKPGGGSG